MSRALTVTSNARPALIKRFQASLCELPLRFTVTIVTEMLRAVFGKISALLPFLQVGVANLHRYVYLYGIHRYAQGDSEYL